MEFQLHISPSNEYSGLISFRMDWLDLLAVQGTLKSLLQHHSSKASILWHSVFLIVQLSHAYMTTGETKAFARQTFVGKEMSLVFNMLSSLVITFLLRSKRLLTSWLKSPSEVIWEPPKIKSFTVSIVFLFAIKWWNQMPWSSFSECCVLSQIFHYPLSLSSRGSLGFFVFCHKGGVIWISEVIDISPGNLDSTLCFIQPGILPDVSAYMLNKQGDNTQSWCIPFPIWNQFVVLHPVLTVASWLSLLFTQILPRWLIFTVFLGWI